MTELKKLRIEREKTQVEVAREVGCSLATYRLWEAQISTPSEKYMGKLVAVLGEEAAEILTK